MARGAEGCVALDMSKFLTPTITTWCVLSMVDVCCACFDMAHGAKGYVLLVIENLDNPALLRGCTSWKPNIPLCTVLRMPMPELEDGWVARSNFTHVLDRVARCQATIGKEASVPIIIGPVTFLCLARGPGASAPLAERLQRVLPAYRALLGQLKAMQAHGLRADVEGAYAALAAEGVPIHLATYYDDLGAAYPWVVALPVAAVGLDFLGVLGAAEANCTLELIKTHGFPAGKRMGAGVVDGRSVWADTGLAGTPMAMPCVELDWLALCCRSCARWGCQTCAYTFCPTAGTAATLGELASYRPKELPFEIEADKYVRSEPFDCRRDKQIAMPAFPTTSIGSFPQTADVRRLRLQYKQGRISRAEYDRGIASHIGFVIGIQESLGMDVLVHGESERTDMVEYFGQALEGMLFTQHGWVQSYGSRYVRPPLIVGDIAFTRSMTVDEFKVAQALTRRPVKGMLTGPVTILNWSFPRHDITRRAQALQLALALRQEVAALEAAGCRVVQVDEPALREGLTPKSSRWAAYLGWAVDAFRLSTAVAAPATQVVTHLSYSDFQDIMAAIDDMDADVLTIENSRSGDDMVRALAASRYGRDIGPGVYDVHSPVVPSVEFMKSKIRSFVATGILDGRLDRIWVNPDCGLKTRGWEETIPALRNMVQAAAEMRAELAVGAPAPSPASGGEEGAFPATAQYEGGGSGGGGACPCCSLR
eukprot:gene5552-4186_t